MTTMTDLPNATDRPPEEAPRADRRFEVILDELVLGDRGPLLAPDFTSRVLASRPFAPWEVRRRSAWRVPVATGGALLAGSLGLTLTPLLTLGPETAATVWSELLALAVARPVGTLAAAGPVLAKVAGVVSASVTPGALLVLGVSVVILGVALAALFGLGSTAPATRSGRNG